MPTSARPIYNLLKGCDKMQIYVPDYYGDFKCIANKCRHNCCIGWEIDIDGDTYEKYKNVQGELGKKLRQCISTEGETHFKLAENDRCPFLNENNLCEIIISLGENALCHICGDHPRFKNFFEDRTEIGPGLCCEAAAELIIKRESKAEIILLEDGTSSPAPQEQEFFDFREEVFGIIQNRELPLKERIGMLIEGYNLFIPKYSFKEWAEIYSNLERLDSSWDALLEKLTHLEAIPEEYYTGKWEVYGEQLLMYFTYRHLAEGIYDGSLYQRLSFAVVSHMIITAVCAASGEDICEVARQYSSEAEYSEDNLDALLDILC